MSILLDVVLPTIVVGMLILLIFGVQTNMLESSVENRVTREMQQFADLTVQVVHEHVRDLQELISINDSTLVFRTFENNQVQLAQQGRDLTVLVTNSASDTLSFTPQNLSLSRIQFGTVAIGDKENGMLRVIAQTESRPDQEVGQRTHRHRGFAHRDIYLRNLYLSQ